MEIVPLLPTAWRSFSSQVWRPKTLLIGIVMLVTWMSYRSSLSALNAFGLDLEEAVPVQAVIHICQEFELRGHHSFLLQPAWA